MKRKMKNRNIMVGLTVLSALFASCSSSDMAEDNPGVGKKVDVTFNAGIGASSRMVMTDNGVGNGISNVWATGDQIGVVDAANSKNCACTETSISSTDQHQATFHGEIDAINENDQLYAYYPASSVNGTTATFDISAQTGALNGTTGLEMTAPRYAAANYKSDGTTSFDFTNATCIWRVNIKVPDAGVTVKTLTLSAPGSDLVNKRVYSGITPTDTKGNITATLNGTSGTSVDANKELISYLNVFTTSFSRNYLLKATTLLGTDVKDYYYSCPVASPSFVAGKTYTINLDKSVWTTVMSGFTSDFYQWDGVNPYSTTNTADYNNTTVNSSPATNVNAANMASHSCKDCPTYDEVLWYLSAGVYYDTDGPHYKFTKTDGTTVTSTIGYWFKKKSKIAGFSKTTAPSVVITSITTTTNASYYHTGKPDNISDYFFVPSIGYYDQGYKDGSTCYWSSTPSSTTSQAYRLFLKSGGLDFNVVARTYASTSGYGFRIWKAE